MWRGPVIVALAFALAGCGGDDQLSADEYRSKLREICKQSDAETQKVDEPTRATGEAIADYLKRLRDVNARNIDRVEDLKPPDDLKPAHDRAMKANREGREAIDEMIRKLEGGEDPTEVLTSAQAKLSAATKAKNQASEDVGVPECASGTS